MLNQGGVVISIQRGARWGMVVPEMQDTAGSSFDRAEPGGARGALANHFTPHSILLVSEGEVHKAGREELGWSAGLMVKEV